MKKVLVLVAVVISASFASCKKDYVCKCTVTAGGVSYSANSGVFKAKKKDAESTCSSMQAASSGETCEAVKQ